jgi:meso-butanediol dehydrogenase/(S,S)-butanediol dehydrogenase/diacetyl reductase
MKPKFESKVAVVTGGLSGIGLATVRLLVAEGCRVMVGDLHEIAADALVQEMGAQFVAFKRCDVANFEEVQALMQAAVSEFGGLDILVNNAGMGSEVCSSETLPPETWRRVIAVDLDSVFYGCKVAIPLMRLRGGGAVVNVASISGLGGDYGFNAYNAAKGAVVNYTRSLAMDHAVDNIRVNAVCPGLVATRMTAFMEKRGILPELTKSIPMKRIGRAEEIARVIVFLASTDASYMTGSIVVADGGQTASTGNTDLRALMSGLAN